MEDIPNFNEQFSSLKYPPLPPTITISTITSKSLSLLFLKLIKNLLPDQFTPLIGC